MEIQFSDILNSDTYCLSAQQETKHKLEWMRNVDVHTIADIDFMKIFFIKP